MATVTLPDGNVVTGSSSEQLEARLRNVPGFLGVFAADQLPEKIAPRPGGSSIVVNYSRSDDKSGGTHWIAMLRLNDNTPRPPFYFDSYGYAPDADDAILDVKTGFKAYLLRHSTTGTYQYSKEMFQAPRRDPYNEGTCGSWSAFAVVHGPPTLSSGAENPAWSIFEATVASPYATAYARGNLPSQIRNDALVRRVMKINPAVVPPGLL